jgi:hypothetical protein
LIAAITPDRHHLLFPQQGVTLRGQSIELFALLIDALGIPFFGLATRAACGLFNQLPDIILKYCDPIVELRSR